MTHQQVGALVRAVGDMNSGIPARSTVYFSPRQQSLRAVIGFCQGVRPPADHAHIETGIGSKDQEVVFAHRFQLFGRLLHLEGEGLALAVLMSASGQQPGRGQVIAINRSKRLQGRFQAAAALRRAQQKADVPRRGRFNTQPDTPQGANPWRCE